jgi:undecaprenyl diphosphate synthase
LNSSPPSTQPPSPTGAGLDTADLPAHVAIIMDGNGRWAKKRLLNRISGHRRGTETVRVIIETCRELGISLLTLYAFSTENWQRPRSEVSALMTLLNNFLKSEQQNMVAKGIRLNVIGQIERLPAVNRQALQRVMDLTCGNRGMTLNLALSYGGRDEIVTAARLMAAEVRAGRLDPEAIDEDLMARYLYTREMPDPDLLIRTSGEMRISNFLLWQIAYSEIYVTPTLWPDFGKEEFVAILKDFQGRERRFGRIG